MLAILYADPKSMDLCVENKLGKVRHVSWPYHLRRNYVDGHMIGITGRIVEFGFSDS